MDVAECSGPPGVIWPKFEMEGCSSVRCGPDAWPEILGEQAATCHPLDTPIADPLLASHTHKRRWVTDLGSARRTPGEDI